MTTDIVALLLADEMPPERIGELLRSARKRAGLKRKEAARRARIEPGALRKYENGLKPIPADVCARLAECYGEDLTAHVPLRVPPLIEHDTLVVGDERRDLSYSSIDEVVGAYAEIVRRMRGSRFGDPFPLRVTDLAAISAALEADPALIEERLMDALGCTREEARTLHRDLLRRRIVVPVAGLAAGVAALAGVHAAQAAAGTSSPRPEPQPPATVPGTISAPPTSAVTVAPPTTAARHERATSPPTSAPVVRPPAPAPAPVVHRTPPPPATAKPTPPPSIPEDDTPVGILPGETPTPPVRRSG